MSKKTTGGLNVQLYGEQKQREQQREILNHIHGLASIRGETFRDFVFEVFSKYLTEEETNYCKMVKK